MPQYWDAKNETEPGIHTAAIIFLQRSGRHRMLIFPHRRLHHSVRFQMELPVETLISDGKTPPIYSRQRIDVWADIEGD